ncbi:hypothetical protein [Halobacterium jilantaiense]|uniref:Uncharacterized protein n=1 Tax=Halobacterium jilantaiense TaxID=355548 RepID=A0A1I0PVG6_9EURY|nr:hypothetical protein [Halobacterium jilantaiense]SEW18503.1 hypothetical protein SAMN04487945_2006 [Halobacterium jilantaiense]
MSLADSLERAGVVVGTMVLSALPGSILVTAVDSRGTPWWGPLVVLAPAFVLGWALAHDRPSFDYDDVWFVCLLGYLLTVAGLAVSGVSVDDDGGLAVLAVGVAAYLLAAGVRYWWRD